MLTYYQLKNDITALLQRAGLPADGFKIVPGPIFNEGLYYEIHGATHIIGYFERGTNNILIQTNNIDELYYYIVEGIVSNYAIDYELKHRIPFQNCNRIYYDKMLEWMKKIDESYYERFQSDFYKMLDEEPFDDDISIQMDAVSAMRRIFKTLEIPFSVNPKMRELRRDIKDIKEVLFSSEGKGQSDYYKFFKTIMLDVSEIYKEMQQLKIPIDDSIRKDLEFALSKAFSIIQL